MARKKTYSKAKRLVSNNVGFYECPLYRHAYHYMLGWEQRDACDYVNSFLDFSPMTLKDRSGCVVGIEGDVYIWIESSEPHQSLQDLAHECIHAANYVARRVGLEDPLLSEEPYAYLVGLIFAKGLEFLPKKWKVGP